MVRLTSSNCIFQTRLQAEEDKAKREFWKQVIRETSERGLLGEHLLAVEAEGLHVRLQMRGSEPESLLAAVLVSPPPAAFLLSYW